MTKEDHLKKRSSFWKSFRHSLINVENHEEFKQLAILYYSLEYVNLNFKKGFLRFLVKCVKKHCMEINKMSLGEIRNYPKDIYFKGEIDYIKTRYSYYKKKEYTNPFSKVFKISEDDFMLVLHRIR